MDLQLYRLLVLRTEFIAQQDKNLDEQYVEFLQSIKSDPFYEDEDFQEIIEDEIVNFGVCDDEVHFFMETLGSFIKVKPIPACF